MKRFFKYLLIGATALGGASAVPVIPQDTTLLYSYQQDVFDTQTGDVSPGEYYFRNGEMYVYESRTLLGAKASTTVESAPYHKEVNKNTFDTTGYAEVKIIGTKQFSVFQTADGTESTIPITAERYASMGLKDGQVFNPTHTEYISYISSITSPKKAGAAIAFDAASSAGLAGPATSITMSLAVAGSNELAIAGCTITDTSHTATAAYNGTSMSATSNSPHDFTFGNRSYFWTLYNPDSGTHNVVVSLSGSAVAIAGSAAYTGVDSTQPDNQANNEGSGTTLSSSITTVADNAWLAVWARNNGSLTVAGSDSTERSAGFGAGLYDSNAAKTPAGSHSISTNSGSSVSIAHMIISIKPSAAAVIAPVDTTGNETNVIWWE